MTRRRLYLMRHADVAYFREDGTPVRPEEVPLTAAGREQAEAARRHRKLMRKRMEREGY